MKEYEINISDWIRILAGEVPAHFYVEVILKLAVLYLILMVSMRVMGKRLSAQLGRNEMAAYHLEVCYHCGGEKSSGLHGSQTCRNCTQINWVSAVLASTQ